MVIIVNGESNEGIARHIFYGKLFITETLFMAFPFGN